MSYVIERLASECSESQTKLETIIKKMVEKENEVSKDLFIEQRFIDKS